MAILLFIIAAALGYAGGRLAQQFKFPAILGWLLVGMIIGPHVIGLMNEAVTESSWHSILIMFGQASIGMMMGKNIIWSDLKTYGKEIAVLSISEMGMSFVLVTAAFAAIFYGMGISWMVAPLIGGIAAGTAPAPALAIMSSYEPDEALVKHINPLLVLNSFVVTFVFLSALAVLESLFSSSEASVLMQLSLILFIPIGIGVFFGFLAKLFLTPERDENSAVRLFIAYSLAVFALVIAMDFLLYPEPNVNFVLFGTAFMTSLVNATDKAVAKRLAKASGPYTKVGLFLVILNLATSLDPKALWGAGILGLSYAVIRGFGKWASVFLVGKVLHLNKSVQHYGGILLWPHSGRSIFLSSLGAAAIAPIVPEASALLATLIPAGGMLSEIVAILVAKRLFTNKKPRKKLPAKTAW